MNLRGYLIFMNEYIFGKYFTSKYEFKTYEVFFKNKTINNIIVKIKIRIKYNKKILKKLLKNYKKIVF